MVIREKRAAILRVGMKTSTFSSFEAARASGLALGAESFTVQLTDGRAISIPYAWFPKLAEATGEQRAEYRLTGHGRGIHWPLLDEDLSVAGLLRD